MDANYVKYEELSKILELISMLNDGFQPSNDSSIDIEAAVLDANGEKLGTIQIHSDEGYVFVLNGK